MTTLREAAQQALEVLERAGEELRWQAIGQVQRDLRAALAESEPCLYPDCVDNGPNGKCTRWLLAECSMSEDYKRDTRKAQEQPK